jgi:heparanase
MRRLILGAALGMLLASPAAANTMDLSKLSKRGTVDVRYQGFNVEMVEVTGGRFWAPFGGPPGERYRMRPPVDLTNPRLRHLARHLGPTYMRVSGTWANSTYLPAKAEKMPTPPTGFNQVLTRYQWRGVVAFAKAIDARVVTSFPASPGARDSEGRWKPQQAQRLIDLTHEAGGQIYGAELFNEPTMPQHGAFPTGYSAADYGRDFAVFRAWAKKAAPEMKLTGPGGTAEGAMLKEGSGMGGAGGLTSEALLSASPGKLDIFAYHHYGTVSPRCGPMKFGTPNKALSSDFLALTEIDAAHYTVLRDKHAPGAPIWLNETAQAACGGSPWASSFLDSFRYVNQLGVLAQKGVQVVMHNTLAASDYALIDQDTLAPRPNYWAALLWRRTMGRVVLDAPRSPSPDLRLYAHCLSRGRGGVGLLAINTGTSEQSINTGATGQRWTMTATPLDSKMVMINDASPAIDDNGRITGLDSSPVGSSVDLPGQSITFVAVPTAGNKACR